MHVVGSGGDYVAEWVGGRLGFEFVKPFEAVGVYDEFGALAAGVVYHMKRESNIEMAIASATPRWATRKIIRQLLDYPFRIGCRRITALARVDNAESRRLLEGVGFVHEGTMRESASDGADYLLYGMTKKDLEESSYGKERAEST